MSLHVTAPHSSRIRKTRKSSAASSLVGLRRSISSPSSASSRRKSSSSVQAQGHDDDENRLNDTGVIALLTEDLNFRDVPQFIEYIRNTMFGDIPETGAGMNSSRIAEVLNHRKSLPPLVTVAHLDALSPSSTRTERELVELAQAGVLRRVLIPHRGVGAAAVGDGIASVREWQSLVRAHTGLDNNLKAKYITLMDANSTSTTVPNTSFLPAEISSLTAAGFLTSTTPPDSRSSSFASPGAGSLGTLAAISSSGSRYAAGSFAAVGGAAASQHIPGGGTGRRPMPSAHYNFSLPNTGSHIKLVVEARNHLLSMVKKSKYKEVPMETLRERWDGGILGKAEIAEKKKARGEFAGVLPGKTKMWKQFYGLRFEWILEECVGAGLLELFETGSVGKAVRAI
ncbi:serine-threonine protein kinase 19-domain-containing protein [Massariosphaeria phaeospora]|uniref:Serine-threonine protein kinase 19-domain-containing protein n=1 Tax=Massariosphaeria phaeospora TaxID=100035 RepID=A0A7C8MW74_9PLEO|nr:serine-threonine protein kinase 19-domain-containing protein [Massariosphaeria phaeospora]